MSLDTFASHIVKLVRAMPDEAILALVRHQLGVATRATPPGEARVGRVASRSRRQTRAASGNRETLLETVERLVKGASGLSARELAEATGVPQPRAAYALKELRQSKRIFQGGHRRFARYAGNSKTAELASLTARKTASGPTRTRRGAK